MALGCAGQMKVGELNIFEKMGLVIQEQVAGTRLKFFAPRRRSRELFNQSPGMLVLTFEPAIGSDHGLSMPAIGENVERNQNCNQGIKQRIESRAIARTEKTDPGADSKENHDVHGQRVVPKRMVAD